MAQFRGSILPACFLLFATFVQGAVRGRTIRITVLDAETHSVALDTSGVPKNCDGVSFDAYCFNSKTSEITNTLVVQEGHQPPFEVACSVDTKWSRCAPLLKGESFEARKEKHGLIVYYVDDVGKLRKQFYAYVGAGPINRSEAAAAVAHLPANAATPAAPSVAISAAAISAQAPAAANGFSVSQESVKCSFTSSPSGSEVRLDGEYVGSTPSEISVRPGKHDVVVSMPGFASWEREMTVSSGSELTVNAVLEKTK